VISDRDPGQRVGMAPAVLTQAWREKHSSAGCAAMLTVCLGQALLSPYRARAFARNLTVIGLPSAALLFPEYLFAASLDVRRDALLDSALSAFPFLQSIGVSSAKR